MKIDRLISIVIRLLDKKCITAQELATEFEVSIRTIYRDIDTIDRAGIPVSSTSGVGGGFQIMPQYKLDHTFFSTTDLSTILMGLSNLPMIVQNEKLSYTSTKIRGLFPKEKVNEIEMQANQLLIDLSTWSGIEKVPSYLDKIKRALEEKKQLSFEYIDCHRIRTERIVEPYQLILKSSQWYFHGYCLKRNDFRLFRLSRISHLDLLNELFVPRPYQKPQLDFIDGLATLQTKITIRIHQSIKEKVEEYCSLDCFFEDGPEHYLVDFPFIATDYYYNVLLGFGTQCECLTPLSVRTDLKRRIDQLVHIYET